MDELSVCGPTKICEFRNDTRKSYEIRPEDADCVCAPFEAIAALGSVDAEADRLIRTLLGRETPALTDFVALNAGAVLYTADRADSLAAGVVAARELLHDGTATAQLRAWVAAQNRHPERGIAGLEERTRRVMAEEARA